MKRFFAVGVLLALSIIGLGCGASNSSQLVQDQSGNVFLTGEDAPLAAVVGFNVTLNSVTLNAQDGSAATVISSPVTVDFARLLGLRSPLAFNSVAANTYTSATFVLANPVISYVDVTQNPPALNQLNGTFPNNQNPYTVTVNFPTAMVVGANGLAGLKMEMDIRQSVAIDANGQITGAVNPVIYVRATKATDRDGQITDLMGGLVSVNAGNNSFVLQGPYGHQLTVHVNGSTSFNSGWNINDLATPAFVAVQGYFQADGSLMATGVEVVTTAHSFVSGRVLAETTNGSGQLQTVTMWIGETGADMVSYADTIQTINVSAVNTYDICFLSGPVLNAVFNDTSVVVGQRIFIGGSFASSVFTPQMISLRLQGVYGMFVPGTVTVSNGNAGTFQLSNNGLVGYSAAGPVTVNTYNFTGFFNLSGLGQLQTTSSAIPVVARGLLLKDQVSGNPEMYAGWVATTPSN
ncbi:MAG: DUF5666 domain-containing protein [Candidatus Sulfotelmatobacter sp.]